MNKFDLTTKIEEVTGYDDQVLVVFQDSSTGEIFSIEEVTYEPRSCDEGGNPTSTGATLFLRGTAS